jgi:hypothetical protein
MTNAELLDLYEISSTEERREMAHELYTRLFRYVVGSSDKTTPQQQLL